MTGPLLSFIININFTATIVMQMIVLCYSTAYIYRHIRLHRTQFFFYSMLVLFAPMAIYILLYLWYKYDDIPPKNTPTPVRLYAALWSIALIFLGSYYFIAIHSLMHNNFILDIFIGPWVLIWIIIFIYAIRNIRGNIQIAIILLNILFPIIGTLPIIAWTWYVVRAQTINMDAIHKLKKVL